MFRLRYSQQLCLRIETCGFAFCKGVATLIRALGNPCKQVASLRIDNMTRSILKNRVRFAPARFPRSPCSLGMTGGESTWSIFISPSAGFFTLFRMTVRVGTHTRLALRGAKRIQKKRSRLWRACLIFIQANCRRLSNTLWMPCQPNSCKGTWQVGGLPPPVLAP